MQSWLAAGVPRVQNPEKKWWKRPSWPGEAGVSIAKVSLNINVSTRLDTRDGEIKMLLMLLFWIWISNHPDPDSQRVSHFSLVSSKVSFPSSVCQTFSAYADMSLFTRGVQECAHMFPYGELWPHTRPGLCLLLWETSLFRLEAGYSYGQCPLVTFLCFLFLTPSVLALAERCLSLFLQTLWTHNKVKKIFQFGFEPNRYLWVPRCETFPLEFEL